MDITVTFRHMDPTESLKTYAEEKVSKINKILDSPSEAHIVLGVEKFRHIADVTFNVNGARIKAVEETGDMYSAIDRVMDKIETQVKRHRSKIRKRTPGNIKGEETAKPMDPEEAAMQLEISQQDFLVFRNSQSKEINVLYKRGDGNLGLIEPSK